MRRDERQGRAGDDVASGPQPGATSPVMDLLGLAAVIGNQAMGAAADRAAYMGGTGALGHHAEGASIARALMRAPTAVPPAAAPAAAEADTALDPQIDREWKAELRRQIGNRLTLSFTKYTGAALLVRKEFEDKKAQPTLGEQLVEMAIGALAPGYVNMALKGLTGALKSVASVAIERAVKDPHKAVETYLSADALVDKYLTVDGDHAKSGYKALKGALAAAPKTVPDAAPAADVPPIGGTPAVGKGGSVEVNALLGRFTQTFSEYIQDLDSKLIGLDRAALLGVWAAFDQKVVTEAVYAAQLRDLVRMHEEFAEGPELTEGGGSAFARGNQVRLVSAWGVVKPAYLYYHPVSIAVGKRAHYVFVKWVPPEMEATAMAVASNFPVAVAGAPYPTPGDPPIQGHIDDPKTEGERVVEVDMWGKLRYCFANLEGGQATFVAWVAESERPFAEAKGRLQPGGIIRFDPAKFRKGHIPKPPD